MININKTSEMVKLTSMAGSCYQSSINIFYVWAWKKAFQWIIKDAHISSLVSEKFLRQVVIILFAICQRQMIMNAFDHFYLIALINTSFVAVVASIDSNRRPGALFCCVLVINYRKLVRTANLSESAVFQRHVPTVWILVVLFLHTAEENAFESISFSTIKDYGEALVYGVELDQSYGIPLATEWTSRYRFFTGPYWIGSCRNSIMYNTWIHQRTWWACSSYWWR